MKSLVKRIMRWTSYRIIRTNALNRFDAIEELLAVLYNRGFRPTRIIDGGANIGAFACAAKEIFADAEVDLIEPQPACLEHLARLKSSLGFALHPVALVGPAHSGETIGLAIKPGEVTTGAHVSASVIGDVVQVPVSTLDGLLADRVGGRERIFLKLDLQGYELEALTGAEKTLMQTEAILTEVSFFAQAYEPSIAKLIAFLHTGGFDLYDVAALSARARDGRARQGDFLFVRRDSALMADTRWS